MDGRQKGSTVAAAIVAIVTEITSRTISSTIPREETAMQLSFQVLSLLAKAFPPQTHLSQSLFDRSATGRHGHSNFQESCT